MSIVLENILRFVSKGYFKFPRLGGTNPSSGILYFLNAKACCSGCVLSLFIRVPVTSMCGVVVVAVCVCIYICIQKLYRYIYVQNLPDRSVQLLSRRVALHRCPAWSSLPEPTPKQGALLVLLIDFSPFFVFV